jgi:hypothetical protein
VQRAWQDLGVAGALPPDGLLVSFQNHDSSKLDWYLRPTAALEVGALPSGDRRVRLRMSLRVPAEGELEDTSPYITGPDPSVHGLFLTVHLPAAARDVTTTHPDGFTTSGTEQRLRVRTFRADVPAGGTVERTIDFTLPRAMTSLTLLPSARVAPLPLTIAGATQVDDATPTVVPLTIRDGSPTPLWVRAALVATVAFVLTVLAPSLAVRLRRGRRGRGASARSGLGDGAALRPGGEARVLGQDAAGVARLRQLPLGATAGQGGLVHEEVDRVLHDVDGDAVALLDEGDRPAVDGLGGHVADAEAVGPP